MSRIDEFSWNLQRLIRDGFPQKGILCSEVVQLYETYFGELLTPSELAKKDDDKAPDIDDWATLFKTDPKLKSKFRIVQHKKDNLDYLQTTKNPMSEEDLKNYCAFANYTNFCGFMAFMNGATEDGEDLQNDDDNDDEDEESLGLFSDSQSTIKPTIPLLDEKLSTAEMEMEPFHDSGTEEMSIHSESPGSITNLEENQNVGLVNITKPKSSLVSLGIPLFNSTLYEEKVSDAFLPQPQLDSATGLSAMPEEGKLLLEQGQAAQLLADRQLEQVQAKQEKKLEPEVTDQIQTQQLQLLNENPSVDLNSSPDIEEREEEKPETASDIINSNKADIKSINTTEISTDAGGGHIQDVGSPVQNGEPVPGPSRLMFENNNVGQIGKRKSLDLPEDTNPLKRARKPLTQPEYEKVIQECQEISKIICEEQNLTLQTLEANMYNPAHWVCFPIVDTNTNKTGKPRRGIFRFDEKYKFHQLSMQGSTGSWRDTKIRELMLPNNTVIYGEIADIDMKLEGGDDEVISDKRILTIIDCAVFAGELLIDLPFENRWNKCAGYLSEYLRNNPPLPIQADVHMKPYMIVPMIDEMFNRIKIREIDQRPMYEYTDERENVNSVPLHGLLFLKTNSENDTLASFRASMTEIWIWEFNSDACFATESIFADPDDKELGRWAFMNLNNEYASQVEQFSQIEEEKSLSQMEK